MRENRSLAHEFCSALHLANIASVYMPLAERKELHVVLAGRTDPEDSCHGPVTFLRSAARFCCSLTLSAKRG